MSVMIGIDPHKASHTAVAIDGDEDRARELQGESHPSPSGPALELGRTLREAHLGYRVGGWTGLSVGPAARGPGRRRRRCSGHPGLAGPGARPRVVRTRTTPTMPSRWPSPPCGHRCFVPSSELTIVKSCASWPSATWTSVIIEPGLSVGSTPSWPSLHRAELPKKCTFLTLILLMAKLCPATPAQQMRFDLALELLDDVRRLDAQIKESYRRIRAAIKASGTSLTEIYGVGPIIAATLIGYSGDVSRFANLDTYASYNGTAPIEFSSGDGLCIGYPLGATASSTMLCPWLPSPRSVIPESKAGSTSSARSLKARRRRRPSAPSSATSATPSTASSSSTPSRGPGRTIGNDS